MKRKQHQQLWKNLRKQQLEKEQKMLAAKKLNDDEDSSKEKGDGFVHIVSSISSQLDDFSFKQNNDETWSSLSNDSFSDEPFSLCNISGVLELWKLAEDSSHVSANSVIIEFGNGFKTSVNLDLYILKWSASSIITRASSSWFKSKCVYPSYITPEGLSTFIEQWLTGKRVIERIHLQQGNYNDLFHKCFNYRLQFVRLLDILLRTLDLADKIDFYQKLSYAVKKRLEYHDAERSNSLHDFIFDRNSRLLKIKRRGDGEMLAVVVRSSTQSHPVTLSDLNQMSIDIFPVI